MRKPLIAGNWKMFKTASEAKKMIEDLKPLISANSYADCAICPPFTAIEAVLDGASGSKIGVGAQNMYWQENGAFTGEVSPVMIKDLGCAYVILGHSERRQFFGDTDRTVNQKVHAALKHDLIPIVCVGESLAERESGTTFDVIQTQITGSLADYPAAALDRLVVAYEPIWAIGTGKTASSQDAQDVIAFIRRTLSESYPANGDESGAEKVRILYGGSVKPENIAELMQENDIDGALVGGASLEAASFSKIVNFRG